MNCNCPSGGGENTKKLSVVMNKGGLMAKSMRFGVVYVYNVWIPLASVLGAIAFGVVFAMINGYLGFLVFVGTLVAGYFARSWVKAKSRSKFADVPDQMKEYGFQCNRCEHLFIPGASSRRSA